MSRVGMTVLGERNHGGDSEDEGSGGSGGHPGGKLTD